MSDHPPIACAAIDPTLIETPMLEKEITGLDLGDERRNRRACAVIEQLGRQPLGNPLGDRRLEQNPIRLPPVRA